MRRRTSTRSGFTLIEVMIALAILTGALLGMGAFMARFAHTTGTSAAMSLASDLAVARIETVKATGAYADIESNFEGAASATDHPTFSVATEIERTSSTTDDYTTVTVTVKSPSLERPVSKTTIISDF